MLLFLTQGQELLGVVLAAVATMLIGMLWYSRFLFGKKWSELTGASGDITPAMKKQANRGYAVMTGTSLLMSYVLGVLIKNVFAPSLLQAIIVGFLAWIFVATSMAGEYLFNTKPKPWALYILNAAYYLVSLIIGAIILFICFAR